MIGKYIPAIIYGWMICLFNGPLTLSGTEREKFPQFPQFLVTFRGLSLIEGYNPIF